MAVKAAPSRPACRDANTSFPKHLTDPWVESNARHARRPGRGRIGDRLGTAQAVPVGRCSRRRGRTAPFGGAGWPTVRGRTGPSRPLSTGNRRPGRGAIARSVFGARGIVARRGPSGAGGSHPHRVRRRAGRTTQTTRAGLLRSTPGEPTRRRCSERSTTDGGPVNNATAVWQEDRTHSPLRPSS